MIKEEEEASKILDEIIYDELNKKELEKSLKDTILFGRSNIKVEGDVITNLGPFIDEDL